MDCYQEKRNRLLNAVRFKENDRVPFKGGCSTIAAIEHITGRRDYKHHPKEVFAAANKAWNADVIFQFVLPDRQDRQCGPCAQVDVMNGLLSVIYAKAREWLTTQSFNSPEDIRDFCEVIPSTQHAKVYVDHELTKQRWIELNRWGDFLEPIVWLPGHLCGTVSWMWYTIMGYENYLMAHLLYPDAIERLFGFLGEEGRLRNIAIAEAIKENNLLPLVYSGEDICGNDGPLVSPNILHEIYFPNLKRAVQPLVDSGIHWSWHSDGNILPILDELLDCGIDGFQGFEEDKGMNVGLLAKQRCKNGQLPHLTGSVNVTTTFYETPEIVKKDVSRMIKMSQQRGGGVIISPSSSTMENMPLENILAYFEACNNQSFT